MTKILIMTFLLVFIAAEIIFWLRMKIGAVPVFISLLVIVALLGFYGYMVESSDYVGATPSIVFAFSNFIIYGSPLVIIFVATCFFRRPSSEFIHWFAGVFSILYTAAFPLIGVTTVCALGIDCP